MKTTENASYHDNAPDRCNTLDHFHFCSQYVMRPSVTKNVSIHIKSLCRAVLTFPQLLFYYKVYVQPIVQKAILFYPTACITALEHVESKLNIFNILICGLRKRGSIRAVRERYRTLTVKDLHLNEISKF